MTNTELLEKKISESGLMKKFIANALNISPYCLALKISNQSEFKTSEVLTLCKLLGITSLKEREDIFFVNKVD